MLSEIVHVNYTGENAVQFKTKCGELGVEMSNGVRKDMRSIVTAVSAAVTAIAKAMGGTVPTFTADGKSVSLPAIPQGDGTYNMDYRGIEAMSSQVGTSMDRIEGLLDTQLSELVKTDWDGTAKERAVGEVRRYTRQAKTKVSDTRSDIQKFVTEQIAALKATDQ